MHKRRKEEGRRCKMTDDSTCSSQRKVLLQKGRIRNPNHSEQKDCSATFIKVPSQTVFGQFLISTITHNLSHRSHKSVNRGRLIYRWTLSKHWQCAWFTCKYIVILRPVHFLWLITHSSQKKIHMSLTRKLDLNLANRARLPMPI